MARAEEVVAQLAGVGQRLRLARDGVQRQQPEQCAGRAVQQVDGERQGAPQPAEAQLGGGDVPGRVEEVGLLNVLRRPGTPIIVRSDSGSTVYEEGRDYERIADSQLNFRFDHDGPARIPLPDAPGAWLLVLPPGATTDCDCRQATSALSCLVSRCPIR